MVYFILALYLHSRLPTGTRRHIIRIEYILYFVKLLLRIPGAYRLRKMDTSKQDGILLFSGAYFSW